MLRQKRCCLYFPPLCKSLPTVLGRLFIVAARDELHTGVEDLQAVHLSELGCVPGNRDNSIKLL